MVYDTSMKLRSTGRCIGAIDKVQSFLEAHNARCAWSQVRKVLIEQ